MFGRKSKSFLLILIMMFLFGGISFSEETVYTEDILINNVQVADSKNKKEKALKNLFYYYVNTYRYDDIISMADELLKYKLSKKEKYTVYYNLAIAYRNNKKFESAIDAAQEAEYLYPKKIDVKMLMGRIYKDNTLYELAISKFKNVLDLDDGHVTASITLADIYKLQENYNNALNYYKKAISIRKNLDAEVYINTAICYKEVGDKDTAINILENLKTKSKKADVILSEIYKAKKDYYDAKKVLSPYVYGKTVDLEIYSKYAELCIFSKDYTEAKKVLIYYKTKAKKTNVEIVDFLLAEAYYMAGDKKEAIKIYKNILKYTKSEYFKDTVNKFINFEKKQK